LKKKLFARLIMQVHDELVVEAPAEEKEEVMALVKKKWKKLLS